MLPEQVENVIVTNSLSTSLMPDLLQAASLNTAAAYKSLLSLPGIDSSIIADVQLAAKQAYVLAFKMVYLIAVAFGVLAIFCAAFTKTIPKDKKAMQRAVRMENERNAETINEKV